MTTLAIVILMVQAALAMRVVGRFLRTAGGVAVVPDDHPRPERVVAIVPVLDERDRLAPCLEALAAQGRELREILIVDGGSRDGTLDVVAAWAARDGRIRMIDASPVPVDATGKAWGLSVGLRAAATDAEWVLFLDAEVRAAPALVRSLLAHAERTGVAALSVATRQRLSGLLDGLLHPSLLATLVYRFGNPGRATCEPAAVQANGQCFLVRRELLHASRAVEAARGSLCEDVTIARSLAAAGVRVGFYEAGVLAETAMYGSGRDVWRNWPRSLPMRDHFFGRQGVLGLLEVVLVQALPLPMLAAAIALDGPLALVALEATLAACRLGVLAGMARAYVGAPLTYWLSPLADVPVALRLVESALRRRHRWRGRTYARRAHDWVCVEEGYR